MIALPFQQRTAEAIEQRFKDSRVVALADEAGLGKTHVVISLLAARVRQHPRRPLCIFYVASNLVLANENVKKLQKYLTAELGASLVHRVSRRIDGKLQPVTRILELPSAGSLRPGINLVAVTPSTSLTASSGGTFHERELVRKYQERTTTDLPRSAIRRKLALRRLRAGWIPDLLILDEYQSYSQALRWNDHDIDPKSLVPILISQEKVPTLLVSATPFELKLPDPTEDVRIDDRRLPMSFDTFADALAAYSKDTKERLLEAQSAYAIAWETILHRLKVERRFDEGTEDAKSLRQAKERLEELLRKRVVRTYRTDLAQPQITFEGSIEKYSAAEMFGDLTKLHLVAHRNKGWDVNAHIFASSLRFFDYSEHGKDRMHYALGRGISSAGKQRLGAAVDNLFERNQKGRLLEAELKMAGLALDTPPLWVSPSLPGTKSEVEKILIFSGFRAVPIEVCERLRDRSGRPTGKWGRWYLSRSHSPEEASLFWPRIGHALEQLGASRDKQAAADALSIVYLTRGTRSGASENKTAIRVFGTRHPDKTWAERTKNAPGSDIVEALLALLARYGVPNLTQRAAFQTELVIEASVRLKRALDRHFGNPRVLSIVRRTLKKAHLSPMKAFRHYCDKFNWKPMWVEYFDQLLSPCFGDLTPSPEETAKILANAISEAAAALAVKPLQRKNADRTVRWESHLANHLGAKVDSGHENRPSEIRSAFNSPFAPFVLATTSVGEEGLDFHRYCRREIHWDPPATGSSLAQRIGRIVRYRGLLQRRALAAESPLSGFIWRIIVRERASGLVPNFQLPPELMGEFPRVILFALPFTTQFAKAVEVKRHYADLQYFVGMTPDQLSRILPLLIGELSPRTKRKLANFVVDLSPQHDSTTTRDAREAA